MLDRHLGRAAHGNVHSGIVWLCSSCSITIYSMCTLLARCCALLQVARHCTSMHATAAELLARHCTLQLHDTASALLHDGSRDHGPLNSACKDRKQKNMNQCKPVFAASCCEFMQVSYYYNSNSNLCSTNWFFTISTGHHRAPPPHSLANARWTLFLKYF